MEIIVKVVPTKFVWQERGQNIIVYVCMYVCRGKGQRQLFVSGSPKVNLVGGGAWGEYNCKAAQTCSPIAYLSRLVHFLVIRDNSYLL